MPTIYRFVAGKQGLVKLPILHEPETLLAVVGKLLVGADERHAARDGLGNDDVVERIVVVWSRSQSEQRAHHVQVDRDDVNLKPFLNVGYQPVATIPPHAVEVLVALFGDNLPNALDTNAECVRPVGNQIVNALRQPPTIVHHEQEDICVEHVSHQANSAGSGRSSSVKNLRVNVMLP